MRILLLGGGLQGLSVGESLKKTGWTVDVVSGEQSILHSRLFHRKYHYEGTDYQRYFDGVFSNEKYDVVIPMGDKPASFLSKNKDNLEPVYNVKCAVPDYQTFSIVEDKSRFMEFCRDNEFPHPLTASITDDKIEDVAEVVGFPALIKPDFSVGSRGITRVNTIDELKTIYQRIKEVYGSCTLQEYIDNPDYYYNVMLYRDRNGKHACHAISKIVRKYPINAGSSSCCFSVEDKELENICWSVLDKLNWHGMADFDVLQRRDSKEYKIIEINPRVPASLRVAYISGVNFPEAIVRDIMGDVIPQYKYVPGKTLRYMGLDILWFLHSPQRFSKLISWLNFFSLNVYYQDIIASDPSTWYSWIMEGIRKFVSRH